ncbi:hypothetical protein [Vibrio fluvialis]|uniref:hypothetical protein n=1 Tax=Vibrio fluvialis TaxID=676 RepID=UPI0024DF6868|nr:hypothetical protein [Vibrio fluvialis]WIE05918.1 hypothetical protein QN061_18055 [Vibrio fluvialis]
MCLPKNKPVAVPWDEAAPELALALSDYMDGAGKEVANGEAFPFRIGKAYTLLRAEGSELVVVGYQGNHTLSNNAHAIVELAKSANAKTIRVHTKRRGELRFLNSLGLGFELSERRPDEYVLRLKL